MPQSYYKKSSKNIFKIWHLKLKLYLDFCTCKEHFLGLTYFSNGLQPKKKKCVLWHRNSRHGYVPAQTSQADNLKCPSGWIKVCEGSYQTSEQNQCTELLHLKYNKCIVPQNCIGGQVVSKCLSVGSGEVLCEHLRNPALGEIHLVQINAEKNP